MEKIEIKENVLCNIDRNIQPKGKWVIEHWRKDKLLNVMEISNLITTEGKNKILDVMFHGVTQITTWYIGLINDSGFSAVAATDVMSSHSGWTEFTGYSDSTRLAWDEAAASAGAVATNSLTAFSINGTGSIRGMFLTSSNTKSGTTGTLFNAATFASAQSVLNGDTFRVGYQLSL